MRVGFKAPPFLTGFTSSEKTMKILLIQPPIRDFYQTSIRTQPLGLAYLAASLQRCGQEVEILDCQTERKKSIPIPSELFYLRDLYPFCDRSPFKLYTGYFHFGMGWEEIGQKIKDSRADVFGISSSFTPYHGEAMEIARIIKGQKKSEVRLKDWISARENQKTFMLGKGGKKIQYLSFSNLFPMILPRI